MSELKPCVAVSNSVLGNLYIDGEVSDADRTNIATQVPAAEVDRVVRDANTGAARCRAQFNGLLVNGLGAGLKLPTPANVRSVMTASGEDRANELMRIHATWKGWSVDAPAVGRDLVNFIDAPQLNDMVDELMRSPGYYRSATLSNGHRREVANAFTDSLSDAQLGRVSDAVLKQMSAAASPSQKARLDQELANRDNAGNAVHNALLYGAGNVPPDKTAQLALLHQVIRYNEFGVGSGYSFEYYAKGLSIEDLASLGADDLKKALAHAYGSEQVRLEAAWIEATGG